MYGSEARFVFELLQNADDNVFNRAQIDDSEPFVSFLVHPDRIVVDCNEDGFNVANLRAICAVNKSTKSSSHGYIGTKGIGFKSVFMAAWKVHIQSGHFSFSFKHAIGDTGLGMVLPKWEETGEELDGPLTRMTLYLHEGENANEHDSKRQTIFKQLDELQQTCLLFLRKLKRIRIAFYDSHGTMTKSKDFRSEHTANHKCCLSASLHNDNGNTETLESWYHLTRRTFGQVPPSDSRRDPVTGQSATGASTSEVILAFPITRDHVPTLTRQDIFAFLPVRELDFKV